MIAIDVPGVQSRARRVRRRRCTSAHRDIGPAQAAARPKEVTAYNTPLFNMSRQPAVSVPNGVSDVTGLPTGLQLVGRQWDDAGVLQLGHAYQSTTDFHLARPTLQRTIRQTPSARCER